MTRACCKCGAAKPISDYRGGRKKCRDCEKAENRDRVARWRIENPDYNKTYRVSHRDRIRETDRQHYHKNKEKHAEIQRDYRKRNAGKVSAAGRSWRQRNAEYIRGKKAVAYAKNRTHILAKNKARYQRNRERYLLRQRAYFSALPRDVVRKRHLNWVNRNRDKLRTSGRNRARRAAAALSDGYIRGVISAHGAGISRPHIPVELVSAKRAYLQLVRLLKEKT
jgi:hypothetical protein